MNHPRDWLSAYAEGLMKVGFFARLGPTASDVARELRNRYSDEWREEPAQSTPNIEQLLLTYDEMRVYYETIDADAAPGNDIYVSLLQTTAAISEGLLRANDLTETWDLQGATVAGVLNGNAVSLRVKALEGRIDLDIFAQLRGAIGKERRLPAVLFMDGFFALLWLSNEEREYLETGRGWKFAI